MSTIEVPVGIVCACLPAIKSLFSVVFPRAFGSSRHYAPNESNDIRSSRSKKATPQPRRDHPSREITNISTGNSPENQINIRQEWTVSSNHFPNEHHHQHDRHGSDGDLELVGIGAALSTDGLRGGTGRSTPPSQSTAAGIGSSEFPGTHWDVTMSAGGHGVGRTFYISSSRLDETNDGSYRYSATRAAYKR